MCTNLDACGNLLVNSNVYRQFWLLRDDGRYIMPTPPGWLMNLGTLPIEFSLSQHAGGHGRDVWKSFLSINSCLCLVSYGAGRFYDRSRWFEILSEFLLWRCRTKVSCTFLWRPALWRSRRNDFSRKEEQEHERKFVAFDVAWWQTEKVWAKTGETL